jgi:hypothetical protein
VAEPRVVDGLEHHHAAPPARGRVPRQRAQLQVVPARPAAAADAPVSFTERGSEETCNGGGGGETDARTSR